MSAYHFQESDDILAKLLELNQEIARKEQQGEQAIGAKNPYFL
jgi:hypothetical protein